jgi:excinuclease ABC subunit C
MDRAHLEKKKLPDTPGVYFFLGPKREVLYIGKATSLRDRVRSYFAKDLRDTRGPQIVKMVEEAKRIDFRETDSVLEALILEANLIKQWKPRYNTLQKDDKSFNFVVFTNEDFPRVLVVRGKDLPIQFDPKDIKYQFGPFPQGGMFKEAMRIIRKIFPFYDPKFPVTELPERAKKQFRFNQSIGVYPPERTAKQEYARTIQHLRLFFEGKKKTLIKALEKEMKAAAKAQEFEKAEIYKRKLFALTHIQDVSLIKREPNTQLGDNFRIEAYDVAHLSGKEMVGVMTVVENGELKKSDYRKFKIRSLKGSNDPAALTEVLGRRLLHTEWPLPNLIAVDGGIAQLNAALRVLARRNIHIPVVSVVKDERHRPREILGSKPHKHRFEREVLLANAAAHRFAVEYHRRLRSKRGM